MFIIQACFGISHPVYTSKFAWLQLMLYKDKETHSKTDFENEFVVAFKPPTPGALIHRQGLIPLC